VLLLLLLLGWHLLCQAQVRGQHMPHCCWGGLLLLLLHLWSQVRWQHLLSCRCCCCLRGPGLHCQRCCLLSCQGCCCCDGVLLLLLAGPVNSLLTPCLKVALAGGDVTLATQVEGRRQQAGGRGGEWACQENVRQQRGC
jgi:hypothetical protein